ncbi:ribosomal protein S18-alanine N-acetyltransferase [Petrachloros mirabilis]
MEATALKAHIRWMIRRDMEEVLDIERASFLNPWTEGDFIRCLRQANCIGMVAEYGDRVVGFIIYELNKTSIQILNMAVSPEHRRKNIGTQILWKMDRKLSTECLELLGVELKESNLTAQLFFRSFGFLAVDVLRGYYDETDEDCYVMHYRHGWNNG